MKLSIRWIGLGMMLVAGCAPTPGGPLFAWTANGLHFTPTVTSSKPLAAKAPGCDFEIRSLLPQDGPYAEIGILKSDGWVCNDPVAFKKAVQADVCRLGGDVVFVHLNGYGQYVQGTVLIRETSLAQTPAQHPPL